MGAWSRLLAVALVPVATLALAAQQAAAPSPAAPPRFASPGAVTTRTDRAARPWMDAGRPPDTRARALLARMTLEEKFWQLFMVPGDPLRDSTVFAHGAYGVQLLDLRDLPAGSAHAHAAASRANAVQRFFVHRTRLGIPAILFEEGVHGLLQHGATVFPQAVALAASWDTALMGRVAGEIALQSRARGVRQLLSPVVNLSRDQRWGRVEETFGEDAWLSTAMGLAYTRALERAGVVATPKHFVVNHGDGGRDSYPVALDQATLEDLHFPPFRAAIQQGGARSVMASYNSLNGLPATAHRDLLSRTLRGDWGFDGVVIADQGGVGGAKVLHHTAADYSASTAAALRAGLDVIFQGGAHDAPLFWPAFRDGLVPRAVVDTAVLRVLRLKFTLGLFEQPYVVEPVDVDAATGRAALDRSRDLAREAAEASLVLLRNERGVLPLPAGVRRIAIIGEEATSLPSGGYSARLLQPASLVEAVQRRLGAQGTVLHAPGPGRDDSPWVVLDTTALSHSSVGGRAAGLSAEYFANPTLQGTPAATRVDRVIDFTWTFMRPAPGLGTDWYSVRWSGVVELPVGDTARIAVEGDDGYRLWIDDSLVVDASRKTSYGLRSAPTPIVGGERHALRLEYRQTTGNGRLRLLRSKRSVGDASRRIDDAVTAVRGADAAIVTVSVVEGEFQDRASLRLPGRQEELIARLSETGTPLVVVVLAGGAVIATPWLDRVGAVVQAFYPGEAGAEAIARTLFGDANPAGRLPYTVPRSEGQLPLVYDHLPTGRGDDYVDLTGQPLFPFGFGLSYTSFVYRDLALSTPRARVGDTVHVRFMVKNAGAVAGDEVPQLYVRHVTAPTAQPVLALRGFARVSLRPGEERQVDIALPVRALAVRDERGRRAVIDGDVILYVGASSRDIRLRGTLRTLGASR